MLTDPREALAEQSSFVNALTGLAGLAEVVRALAEEGAAQVAVPRAAQAAAPRAAPGAEADDWVHLLLGLASLGDAVARLATPAPDDEPGQPHAPARPPPAGIRWLR